jgi:glycosyltransferase involved in cell wall biosynthesis
LREDASIYFLREGTMKVAVVNGICKKHDAISESVIGTMQAVTDRLGWACRLFTYACDFPAIDTKKVDDVTDVLLDPYFVSCDIVIYHYGIYYELFNALLLGNTHARQIVYYHNITPKEFMLPREHRLFDKSIRQIANMESADEIWTASTFNKMHLIERGLRQAQIEVLPLYVKNSLKYPSRREKPSDIVRILYVGRFVESKGLTDLMKAIQIAKGKTSATFKIDLVGNMEFSDKTYLSHLLNLIERLGLNDVVTLVGQVDDTDLARLYSSAHIFATASYHEGFCVPVVEALRARCLPIVYGVGNVPCLVDRFGEIIEPGNWQDLAEKLARQVEFFSGCKGQTRPKVLLGNELISRGRYEELVDQHLTKYTYEAFADRIAVALARVCASGLM